MKTTTYESHKDSLVISADPARLQLDTICQFLGRSYWANTRRREVIALSVENSLCFGMYDGDKQVGFARVVTDLATYAWLCDVFIEEGYRGRGLGKWLMATILVHPQLQGIRRWALATRDAHGLYRQFGFTKLRDPERLMEKFNPQA